MTLLVLEDLENLRQHKVFNLLGVDYYVTPRAWMNLPLMALIGIVLAFIFAPDNQVFTQIMVGLGYGG